MPHSDPISLYHILTLSRTVKLLLEGLGRKYFTDFNGNIYGVGNHWYKRERERERNHFKQSLL